MLAGFEGRALRALGARQHVIGLSWHQSKAFPVSYQCHRLSTVIHRQWQESVKCCKQHADGPSEIAVVQISRTKYIMKCYHDMVDQIPPKRILWPWNQWESHCIHRRPHIWNSCTSGASRHQNTRELTLEQKVNLHQVRGRGGISVKNMHLIDDGMCTRS